MKLGRTTDEISYVGQSSTGEYSVYRINLDARPVIDVIVDNTSGEILVSEPNHDPLVIQVPRHATKGQAVFLDQLVEDADGNPVGMAHRMSGSSVYRYVLPRLHRLIAQVWVPPVF